MLQIIENAQLTIQDRYIWPVLNQEVSRCHSELYWMLKLGVMEVGMFWQTSSTCLYIYWNAKWFQQIGTHIIIWNKAIDNQEDYIGHSVLILLEIVYKIIYKSTNFVEQNMVEKLNIS